MKIRVVAGEVSVSAELNESETARAIGAALPLEARASVWGDEIYFHIPVHQGEEEPRELVEVGDLGYWPPGDAFCVFFGPTPGSRAGEIRPASAVNVFGRVLGDATVLRSVPEGAPVRVEVEDQQPETNN